MTTNKRSIVGDRGTAGNAAVEMALLLPVLTMVLLGAIDFGRVFFAYITVSSAAHEAAVFAGGSTYGVTTNALATVVSAESKGFLKVGAAPSGNTTVVGPTVVPDPTKVPTVQVEVTYNFQPVTPIPLKGPIPVRVTASSPTSGQVLP